MHLWQFDLVGGIPLADGRACKMVTGIDDYSRFVVIAAVVAVQPGRAVCSAFTAAMRRYGVPFEVVLAENLIHVTRAGQILLDDAPRGSCQRTTARARCCGCLPKARPRYTDGSWAMKFP
jgi:hypothetical protein